MTRWAEGLAGRAAYAYGAIVVATAYVCAFLAFCVWSWDQGIDFARDAPVVTLFQMGAYALAAAACWIAASATTGRRRWAWTCFALANSIATLQIPILVSAPAKSVAWITIAVFLIVNAFGATGLVLHLPGRIAYQKGANLLLDAAIIAGAMFSIVWALVGQDVYAATPTTWDRRLLDLSYPFLSIAVLSLVLFILARTPRDVRSSLRYIAAGWTVLALSMPVYSWLALHGDLRLLYVGPGGVVVFLMLIVVAGARGAGEAERTPTPEYRPSLAVAFAPYLPFAIAIPVVVITYVIDRQYDAPLILSSALVVALVFARLGLFLLETRRLSKSIEESARLKTEMLQFISHELGNPLTPLSIEANLLQTGGIDPHDPLAQRNVQSFLRSVQRLEALSRDVRELAKLEAGTFHVKPREQDLKPLAEAAVAQANAAASQKGIELHVDLPPAGVTSYVDAERVGQVLDNLLSNAIKFTPRDGRVKVLLEPRESNVLLSVEDTGAGLSAGQQKQLFTAFARMHAGLAPGLGLGLVICKAIVDQHGGRIWAESEGPDRGTRFRVLLPRAAPQMATATGGPTPSPVPAKTPTPAA